MRSLPITLFALGAVFHGVALATQSEPDTSTALSPTPGHTFSIVAVDPVSGQVGGAGASCIDNSHVISALVPGRGAIHAQALLSGRNRENARQRMQAGDSPAQIIEWVTQRDANGVPAQRQYGIVAFEGTGKVEVAAFTGDEAIPYKGHINGSDYAIQGNILLGPEVLAGMENAFNATPGTLAEKLMAALQGGKIPGADWRCQDEGISALSAFIRVACPGDDAQHPALDIVVPSTSRGIDPVDTVQEQFDQWVNSHNKNQGCNIKSKVN